MAAYPFTVADLVCPARIAGIFVVMAIGYMGGFSYGAASGVGIGVAMDAAGGVGLYYAGVYAVAGMAAGFFSRGGRVVFAAAFVLTHAAVHLLGGQAAYLSGIYECFVASVCFVLLPESVWEEWKDRLLPMDPKPTDYAARVSRLANHYASVASDAFSEMYQAMANSGKARKEESDLGAVFDRTADRVCRRCSARENCWKRDKLATLRTLDSISGPLLRTGHISSGDFPGHFAAQCLRFSDFVLALNEGMDALFQRRQTQKKNEAGEKTDCAAVCRCDRNSQTGGREHAQRHGDSSGAGKGAADIRRGFWPRADGRRVEGSARSAASGADGRVCTAYSAQSGGLYVRLGRAHACHADKTRNAV